MTRPPSSCDWRVFCLNMGWDLLRNEQQQLASSTVVVCGERSTRGGRARAWTRGGCRAGAIWGPDDARSK